VGSSIETAPCCEFSYEATPGWDASTGLGSPNFGVLANLVLNNATYFPATSAYPQGAAAVNTFTTTGGDDDEVKTDATAGLALGASGLAVGLIALIVGIVLCTRSGGKQNTLLGK
jgi:hypothetical protein